MNLYSPTYDFIGTTSQIMEKRSSIDLGLFFMAAWSIWGNRNNAIHNDVGCPSSQVWEIAKRSLFDFTTSNLSNLPPHPSASVHWSPLLLGFHKLMLMGPQIITGITLVLELLSETTLRPLSVLSTSCSHQHFLLLQLRLLLCFKESFL